MAGAGNKVGFQWENGKRRRIGLVGYRYPKGIGIVLESLASALDEKFDVSILAVPYPVGLNPFFENGAWARKGVTKASSNPPAEMDIRDWIRDRAVQAVVTVETPFQEKLFAICREEKVRSAVYVMADNFDPIKSYWKECDLFIAPTECCQDALRKEGFPTGYAPYGCDLGAFPFRERGKGDGITFVHNAGFGGLDMRKGTADVAAAFRRFLDAGKDGRLIIVTQIPIENYTPVVTGLLKDFPGRVEVRMTAGLMPKGSESHGAAIYCPELYADGDVAVQPSRFEGLGLTHLESMACGLPVVALDLPPAREFIQSGKEGFLVPCKAGRRRGIAESGEASADDLTKALLWFSENLKSIAEMSRAARARVEEVCSKARLSKTLFSALERILICAEKK